MDRHSFIFDFKIKNTFENMLDLVLAARSSGCIVFHLGWSEWYIGVVHDVQP